MDTKDSKTKLRKRYHRITNAISKMMKCGWRFPHWAADPVAWVPREFNNAADSIVNIVMDAKAPLSYKHKDVGAAIRTGYNLKIGTDGGVRGEKVSGAGWVVFAVQVKEGGREGKHVHILKGGTYHGVGMSSLAIETLALDEALIVITSYL